MWKKMKLLIKKMFAPKSEIFSESYLNGAQDIFELERRQLEMMRRGKVF